MPDDNPNHSLREKSCEKVIEKYAHVDGYPCNGPCVICDELMFDYCDPDPYDDPFSPQSIARELARRGDPAYDNCPDGWENFALDPDYGGWDIGDHGY